MVDVSGHGFRGCPLPGGCPRPRSHKVACFWWMSQATGSRGAHFLADAPSHGLTRWPVFGACVRPRVHGVLTSWRMPQATVSQGDLFLVDVSGHGFTGCSLLGGCPRPGSWLFLLTLRTVFLEPCWPPKKGPQNTEISCDSSWGRPRADWKPRPRFLWRNRCRRAVGGRIGC